MELVLERADLLQLDPISHKGTIKLLPPGKKHKVLIGVYLHVVYNINIIQQKLVVGDDSGHLGCYEFKKGEPQVTICHLNISW